MIKYFLFFILHFNLIYSYEKYILPIGIFYNTIPDNKINNTIEYYNNIIKKKYNITNYEIEFTFIYLSNDFVDINNFFLNDFYDKNGDKIVVYIGFWINSNIIKYIVKILRNEYKIINLAIGDDICSCNVFTAYHIKELIYTSSLLTAKNIQTIHLIYYSKTDLIDFYHAFREIYDFDDNIIYYYLNTTSDFDIVANSINKPSNIFYFLDPYNTGLSELINAISGFYSNDYTLIFIGYFNQNIFHDNELMFLENSYFISYYFSNIDNTNNQKYINSIKEIPDYHKYSYDTIGMLFQILDYYYRYTIANPEIFNPFYYIISNRNYFTNSIFGNMFLDSGNYYQHPSYIGKIINKDVVIKIQKTEVHTYTPFLDKFNIYEYCDIMEYSTVHIEPYRILVLAEKQKYRFFFSISILSFSRTINENVYSIYIIG